MPSLAQPEQQSGIKATHALAQIDMSNRHAMTVSSAETVVQASASSPKPKDNPIYAKKQVTVEIAPVSAADDSGLVEKLTHIINSVYGETEGGIFGEGYQRTNVEEVAQIIRARELGVAYLRTTPKLERKAVGCIRIWKLSGTHGELGMMAADPSLRGTGMGTEMVSFAEEHCRKMGLSTMQLDLLSPQAFEHPFKKRLLEWYTRLGYKVVKEASFADFYPHIASLLRIPADYKVFEKSLL